MLKASLIRLMLLELIVFFSHDSCSPDPKTKITGELKTWHTVTLSFAGPDAAEYDTLNPFLDYRLEVLFSNGGKELQVPGYFAADGNAAETSARSGNKWRAHFCPPSEGIWNYKAIFVRGKNIAVSDDLTKGDECFFHGDTGQFTVEKTDKAPPDFRSKGRLKYDGSRYLKHEGNGEVFIKGGADSPENFLGYSDFDGTYYGGNNKARSGEAAPNSGLHLYGPHIIDWKNGDPYWKDGKGKGIIGAINYLSSKGMNSVYMLILNILGDGEDVWPYTDRNERYRFDCSKLDQWDIVFSHADKMGIMLHFVLQETENECLLDCGYLDVQRKLYLRELVARFSHHLAITWNIGEEHHATDWSPYGQTYRDTKLMADYLREIDPYDNFIAIHTHSAPDQRVKDMTEYLGFMNVDGPSVQCGNINEIHEDAKSWISRSGEYGHPWVVCIDEIGPHWQGALPDAVDPAHDTIRYKVLWGNLMAGGGGAEWYFGYNYANSDLSCEDWRSRENLWEQTKIALDFFHNHLPFTEMESADELTRDQDDYCFAKKKSIYTLYLPTGKAADILLSEGNYDIAWYNPRSGGELLNGSITKVAGGGFRSTGNPPGNDSKDWVCVIRCEN